MRSESSTTSLKVYLAALFSRKDEMATVADRLKSAGYGISCRWVYGGEDGLTREEIAILDIEDLNQANAIICFTYPRGTMTSGGGRHVEFGYALAMGKECIIIGERENVFHHCPQVKQFSSVDEFMEMYGDNR